MTGILVVDDDNDIRETMALVLTEAGYVVTQATNGRDALAKLEAMGDAQPGLILLDLVMPEMSGTEVLSVLEERKRLPRLPIVVISVVAQSAEGLGVRKLMPKPISIRALLSVVEELVGAA